MSKYRRAVVLALILLSGLSASAAERVKSGWILHQHTGPLGDQLVYLSPLGVKATALKSGLSIMSQPPFKQLTLYNLKTGKIFRVDAEAFTHPIERSYATVNGFPLKIIPFVKDKPKETAFPGVHSLVYKSPPTFSVAQKARFLAKEFPSRSPQNAECSVTNDLGSNSAINKVLYTWYCLPPLSGLPLDFRYRDMDNDLHEYLTTARCEHAEIKASDFVLPSTLKPASSAQDVYMGNAYDNEAVQMMFGGEGLK